MRFGKTVFAETEDLPEDAIGVLLLVAIPEQAVFKLFLERAEPALAFPGRHGATQLVGFARRETGSRHGDLHDLLLEQWYAQRAFQDGPDRVAGIFDLFLAVLAPQIWMHHVALDGTRPHDGNFDHEVVELLRLEPGKHRHLRARFDLEYPNSVGFLHHCVDGWILCRDILHRAHRTAPFPDKLQRAPDRREHAERQHVDLHQSDRFKVVLVPLDDRAIGHCCILDRHQARDFSAPDHESSDVLGEMPWKPAQLADDFDQLPYGQRARIEARFTQPSGERAGLVPPGKQPGEPVDLFERKAERLAHVPQGAFRSIADDGSCDCSALAAILLIDVLDDLLPPVVLEVDIDVGRFVALCRDEALEQQVRAFGIDLGDAEAVTHRGIGCRAASLAKDCLLPREAHDVVNREEVVLVLLLPDECEFFFDKQAHIRRHACGVTLRRAFPDKFPQIGRWGFAFGHDLLRILVAQLVERKPAECGNPDCFGHQRFGIELRESNASAQMTFGVRKERVPRICHGGTQANRGECVLQRAA